MIIADWEDECQALEKLQPIRRLDTFVEFLHWSWESDCHRVANYATQCLAAISWISTEPNIPFVKLLELVILPNLI